MDEKELCALLGNFPFGSRFIENSLFLVFSLLASLFAFAHPSAALARFPNSDPEYIPNYLTAGTWEAPSNPGCNSEQVVFEFPGNYEVRRCGQEVFFVLGFVAWHNF